VADVIVQYAHTPTARHHQRVLAAGGVLKHELSIVKGAHYTLPVRALRELAEDPEVTYISTDRPVRQMLDVTAPSVNAQIAWQYGWTGKGIGVAVIDSGISDSPDLHDPTTGKTRVLYSQAFGVKGTVDVYGHGSHVSGIIGGNGSSSSGKYKGIAPDVNFVDLSALDNTEMASTATSFPRSKPPSN
jgi:serine protease AprX